MRSIKYWMAIILCIALLVGCQATPDQDIVVQKDMAQMLEKAQKDTAGSTALSLSEQYDIPKDYQFETQSADGNLNIHVDAQVIVPEGSAIPIYRVNAEEFSQDTVSAFFETLCGDAEMWIDSGQLTKDQIQQLIVQFKKRIAEIENDPQLSDELAMNEEMLAQYEQELETAPDTLDEERTDGMLIDMSEPASDASVEEGDEPIATPAAQAGGAQTGLEAYERYNGGTGRSFTVYNDSNPVISYYDFRNPASAVNFGYSASLPVLEDSDVDPENLSKVGIEPSEAKQMVQDLLDVTDSGMAVDSIYLQNDAQSGEYGGDVRPAEQYAYLIYCVRAVDGLPCSFVFGESMTGEAAAPYWRYETMYFLVNSEGIFNMWWTCPLEVVETVNGDAQIEPFSEIQQVFEKMMRVKYEAQAEYNGYDFEINRVTLSLHRIIEQNSNESGLLVPAWNFYGKLVTDPDDPLWRSETLGQSFLTINAIDGSIIDIYKGY